MLKQIAERAHPMLNFWPIRRTRRNHGLEHATVHMMQRKVKTLRVSGMSTPFGFILFHNAPADVVEAAAHDALKRMKSGEHDLAVHPACGTNLMTAAALTTLVGLVTLAGRRRITRGRLNQTMMGMILAMMVAQPLGMNIQKHFTTEGNPGDLKITSVQTDEVRLPMWNRKFSVTLVWTDAG